MFLLEPVPGCPAGTRRAVANPPLSRGKPAVAAGFTLLEMLVALTILSFIFVLMFGALRLGARSWTAGEAAVERIEEFQTSYGLIRRLVERAFPMAWGEPGALHFAFEGEPKTLRFVALFPAYPGLPGPQLVTFDAAKASRGEELRLSWVPFSRDEAATLDAEPIEDIVLVPGPVEIEFDYFGPIDDNGEPEWQRSWKSEDDFPRLIRLSIVRADDGRPYWPSLVMPIAITMDGACLFVDEEPISKCRLDDLN